MPETRSSANKAAEAGDKQGSGESRRDSTLPDAKRRKNDQLELSSPESDVKKEDEEVTARESQVESGMEESQPSLAVKILEKGIVYFFTRGRVNVDEPQSIVDIARSYLILRPVPPEETFGGSSPNLDGAKRARILVLPRKTLPKKRGERMMAFVDRAGESVAELGEDFLQGAEYETKTVGTSHVPPATPVGEGVYAMTATGRDSHLCYILTLPSEPGALQDEFGLASRGSFIISTKNPQFPGPRSARLPRAPEYPKRVLESFESYRWIPSAPEHLDYQNAQVLLIREGEGLGRAGSVEPGKAGDDLANEAEANFEEAMEELEGEDVKRMERLGEDASQAIYADLKADSEKYPSLRTQF